MEPFTVLGAIYAGIVNCDSDVTKLLEVQSRAAAPFDDPVPQEVKVLNLTGNPLRRQARWFSPYAAIPRLGKKKTPTEHLSANSSIDEPLCALNCNHRRVLVVNPHFLLSCFLLPSPKDKFLPSEISNTTSRVTDVLLKA
jgi:hypothetical protein